MQPLQPAGLLGRIISHIFPDELHVEVCTEILPDGTVELVPVYSIAGREVSPELIAESATQTILGRRVNAPPDVLLVHHATGGKRRRCSKKSAGTFIEDLRGRGVRFRSNGKQTPPQVASVKPELSLELADDDSLWIRSRLTTPSGLVVDKPVSIEELQKEGGWFVAGDDLFRVDIPGRPHNQFVLAGPEVQRLEGSDVPRFVQQVQQHPSDFSSVEKNSRLEGLEVYGDQHEHRMMVDGEKDVIRLQPSLTYLGKGNQPLCQPSADELERALGKGRGFHRIPQGWVEVSPEVVSEFEHSVVEVREKIGELDEIRGGDIPRTLLRIVDPNAFSTPWAVYFSQHVKDAHRVVTTPAESRFTLNVVEADGKALLELDARYNHERFRVSHSEAAESLAEGEEWVRRENAWVRIDQKRIDRVNKAIAKLGLEATEGGARFPASRREEVIELFSRLGTIEHGASYARFLAQLADFEKIEEVPLPIALRTAISFRPYQQHGYNWLMFLRKFGLNGILADDMGLGKTLQTLAAIRMEQERTGGILPSLVVCPTSLVANWRAEASKFFEGFNIITYTGPGRKRHLHDLAIPVVTGAANERMSRFRNRLVITSYGIALRDHEELNGISWMYVVVDEAHHIKNPAAQRTRAIKTINASHKLALTGTPIQNNLDELWSLFDFAMPNYLGSRGKFRKDYGNGDRIDWEAVGDEERGLRRRIHPFILRRLKEDVAADLPEKVIVDLPVELSPKQVSLYKATIESAEFKRLVEAVETKGSRRASTEILAIYTRLRTICNHPILALHGQHEFRPKDSGKLQALKELIEEVCEGGHRALIFCQSTKMLDLIGRCFAEWQIETRRLDGETPPARRQELVDEFNRNANIVGFLISTRAGGTGLNLTGADTVIFYDHDWNPANDRQAQDRAYRIGQTRNVTVYRLVSIGTIEERIIERQELKQTLADQVIGVDSEGFKELTKDQLLSLFEFRG